MRYVSPIYTFVCLFLGGWPKMTAPLQRERHFVPAVLLLVNMASVWVYHKHNLDSERVELDTYNTMSRTLWVFQKSGWVDEMGGWSIMYSLLLCGSRVLQEHTTTTVGRF